MEKIFSFVGTMLSILTIALLALFCAPSALAQVAGSTTGQVTGVVKDVSGAVIVGATVEARNKMTNQLRETKTGNDGSFYLVQLPPGEYQIHASAEGFKPKQEEATISLGVTSLIEFILPVPIQIDEFVPVVVHPDEVIEAASSANIGGVRINNLPINRRDFLNFSITEPRVVADRLPDSGFSATSGLSFNGQSGRVNNVTIDGLDNNDLGSGSVRSTFSQDAVQEFQVVANNFSAEFGRALGGIVNIVTSNGSNQYHGQLFCLNRNDKISARDPFLTFKPKFSQYQFGAISSGPIKRDRIFFFDSFERLSVSQNNIVTISDATVASVRRQGFELRNGAIPFSVGKTSVQARVDAQLNNHDTLWVRYQGGFGYDGAFEPLMPLIGETNGGIQRLRDNSIAINNTFVNQAANVVIETRFLYSRRKLDVLPLNDDPQITLFPTEGSVIFGRNMTLPQLREERIYQLVNNISVIKGGNQIKFGVDYQFIGAVKGKTAADIAAAGGAVFAPLDFTANGGPFFSSLQSFDASLRTTQQQAFLLFLKTALPRLLPGFPQNVPLDRLSLPAIFLQGFGNPDIALDTRLFTLFAQDDLKLKPNLLINFGIRYDRNDMDLVTGNRGNLAPRLAISYHPGQRAKLLLHAGYGLYFGVPGLSVGSGFKLLNINKYQLVVMPFPFSVLPFALPGHHFPESQQLPAGVTATPQLAVISQPDSRLRNSYTQQLNAGIDYKFTDNSTLSISYTFVRGIKLLGQRNINPVIHPVVGDPLGSLLKGRVDPSRGDLLEFESAYDSYYHGLTLSFNRRFRDHFDLVASYTYSKAIDNLLPTFPGDSLVLDGAADPLKPGNERGLSIQDLRHRLVLSTVWRIQLGRTRWLKGFQLSEILTVNSGRPYNLLAGVDLNRNGDSNDRPAGLGRNVGITPGFTNLDLRLSRNISIRERYRIEGFVEVFNLFNKVNIDPNTIDRIFPPDRNGNFLLPKQENGRYIVTPDRYRSALPARQFQFGFRIGF